MSLLVEMDDFQMGLTLCHDTIRRAISQYNDFLLTYGTCPDMRVVTELNKCCDKILQLEQSTPLNAFVDWANNEEVA